MSFTESNTVEQMILDAASFKAKGPREEPLFNPKDIQKDHPDITKWIYLDDKKVSRNVGDVMVEKWVRPLS